MRERNKQTEPDEIKVSTWAPSVPGVLSSKWESCRAGKGAELLVCPRPVCGLTDGFTDDFGSESPEAVSVACAGGEKPAGNVLGKRPADIPAQYTAGPHDGDRKNIGEGFPGPSVSSGLCTFCARFCDCPYSLLYHYTC